MPIVGHATVLVRVISNRLADDIRDAVKRGLKDADKDIDAEGDKAGERLGKRMAAAAGDSIKKDMERVVGKEVVLATRRLAITASRGADDAGRNWGTRFMAGAGGGILDNQPRLRQQLSESMVRAFTSDDDTFSRIGRQLGGNFTRAISSGAEDAAPDVRANMNRWLGRELTAGTKNEIVRAADVDGKLFMRHFVEGLRQGEERLNDQLRRSFHNTVRDQEQDFANGFRRVFVGSVDAVQDDVTTAFHRMARNINEDEGTRRLWSTVADQWFGRVNRGLNDKLDSMRETGNRLGNSVRDGLNDGLSSTQEQVNHWVNRVHRTLYRRFPQAYTAGEKWSQSIRDGLRSGITETEGEEASNRVSRGVRRGMNRNRPGLLRLFHGVGSDLFKNFNLGFGAAKMGPAIISLIATAAPSILAGIGAIITALVADLVNLMAALGPGLGGAIGVGIAGISSLALNVGLLMAAFKLSGTVLDQFTKDFKAFGELIGTPIAQGMLPGLQEMLESLKSILPQVNDLLTATGERFGAMFASLGKTLAGQENVGRIREILLNNLTFIDNFSTGLNGLVTSFLTLFAASKPFIDYIGTGIRQFGEWAAASLAVSEANGNLGAWMDRMLASFKDLLAIVVNFGQGIGNIFAAAKGPSESLLASIRGIAERFEAWTSSEAGMARMTQFFTVARTLASKVYEVIGNLFKAGGNAFADMDLTPILSVLDTLQYVVGPAIARIFNQIQEGAGPNLVKAFENIGTMLTNIANNGTFTTVANIISGIIEKITEFAASDFGSTILSWVLPIALMGGIITSLIGPLITLGSGMATLASAAAGVSAPVVAIGAAIAAAVAAFVVMWNNSERLRNAIGELGAAIGGAFMAVWDRLAPKIQSIWEKFQELAGVIGDRLAPIIQFITPIIARVITVIGDLLGNALDAISGFIDVLIGIFTGDWVRIWEGVQQIFSAAWNQILAIFQGVLSAISFIWDALVAIIYNAGQVIWGIITSVFTGIATFIYNTWNAIYAFFEGIVNAITGTIRRFGNWIPVFLDGVWEWIERTAVTTWNNIWQFFEDIGEDIADTVRGIGRDIEQVWDDMLATAGRIWGNIVAEADRIWDGIFDAIVQPIIDAYNAVVGWVADIAEVVAGILTTVASAVTTVNTNLQSIMDDQRAATSVSESMLTQAGPMQTPSILSPEGIGGGIQRMLMEHVMNIPGLATGGIVPAIPGGTVFRLGEGGQRERVEPLNADGLSTRDRAMIKTIVASTISMMSGGGVNVDVTIGEHGLDNFVTKTIRRENDSLARRVGKVRR